MKKSKKTLRQIIALMAIAFTTISLTACGGSDDDGDKDDLIAASEYLPGKEWTIGNETYSFYKNHLLVCESSANVTTGGLTSQPLFRNMAVRWQPTNSSNNIEYPTKF